MNTIERLAEKSISAANESFAAAARLFTSAAAAHVLRQQQRRAFAPLSIAVRGTSQRFGEGLGVGSQTESKGNLIQMAL